MSSVAFHTLGCKLNFSETSSLSRSLEGQGFTKKNFDEVADIYVINTCSVTENADKECRSLVRKIRRKAPNANIVITGCYAQLKPDEIASIDGVDLVLGASEKFNLGSHLSALRQANNYGKIHACEISDVGSFHSSYSLSDRTRTFLKVQDGCDYNCSFCTIPLARGHSRSDTIIGVMENIKKLEIDGVKEIVLTGINLGDFGKGADGARRRNETFYDLLQRIDQESNVPRFRISSIEPNLLSDEIIDFVASSKRFMPHFHIPLQSGSNEMLAMMKRRYKREIFQSRIERIKEKMPQACIGVDVIVGFPGETDAHFKETFDFLHHLDITYLHTFTYSERDNTLAATMANPVPINIRNDRNRQLRNLSYQKQQFFNNSFSGTSRPVLFESEKNGIIEGYSDNYIRTKAAYNPKIENTIVDWQL